ncbi:hypothetical protein HDV00_002166 [Rhizophlyctis rosea]|nr:hypothetical protein HDV00_002166 [Rhizophlyctis rosea]
MYNVGHDFAVSALSGIEPTITHDPLDNKRVTQTADDPRRILLKQLPRDRLSSLSFFFAGTNDSRHFFVTAVDIAHQLQSAHPKFNPTQSTSELRALFRNTAVSVVLNDIHPAILARFCIVRLALLQLGQFDKDQLLSNNEAAAALSLVESLYLVGIHPTAHTRLETILDTLLTTSTTPPSSLQPFLHISSNDWQLLYPHFQYWRVKAPSRFSISQMLASRKSNDNDEYMTGMDFKAPDVNMFDLENAPPMKVMMQQLLPSVQVMTDSEVMHMVNEVNDKFGGKFETADELRQWVEFMTTTNAEKLYLNGCIHDLVCFQKMNILLPPPPLMDETLREFVARISKGHLTAMKSRAGKEGLKKAKASILANWKPNITRIDEKWYQFTMQRISSTDNPFDVITNLLASADLFTFPKKPKSFHHWTIEFFHPVAKALTLLTTTLPTRTTPILRIELRPGDMNNVFDQISLLERTTCESKNLPTTFDRIFLSNVPDYTWMLPIFTTTARVLKPYAQSFIQHNMLLANPLYKMMDDYTWCHAGITCEGAERMWGIKHVTGEVYGEDPRWAWVSGGCEMSNLTKDEVEDYIHRVLLSVAVPPIRNAHNIMRENVPMSMAGFMRMLHRLMERGVPRHWISDIVVPLYGGKFVSRCLLREKSPELPPAAAGNGKKVVKRQMDVGKSIRKELRAMLALWSPFLNLALPLTTRPLSPFKVHRYSIKLPLLDNTMPWIMGAAQSSVLGVVIGDFELGADLRDVVKEGGVTLLSAIWWDGEGGVGWCMEGSQLGLLD